LVPYTFVEEEGKDPVAGKHKVKWTGDTSKVDLTYGYNKENSDSDPSSVNWL